MTAWSADELNRIGDADELQIASRRPDGSLRRLTTIWVVRQGDDIYVRAAYGPGTGWYRHAHTAGEGRIRAGGIERDVTFEEPGADVDDALHQAYHAKYDRYGARMVAPVVSDESARLTLRIVPSAREGSD